MKPLWPCLISDIKQQEKGIQNKNHTVLWSYIINSSNNKPQGKLASYSIRKVEGKIIRLGTQFNLLMKPWSLGPVKDKGNLLSDQSVLMSMLPKGPTGCMPHSSLFIITSLKSVQRKISRSLGRHGNYLCTKPKTIQNFHHILKCLRRVKEKPNNKSDSWKRFLRQWPRSNTGDLCCGPLACRYQD